MKDILVEARKALDDLWNSVPVHGRTWGTGNNIMKGSHITLIDHRQCVTVWERNNELLVRGYGDGTLLNNVITCLKEAGLWRKANV